MAAAAGLDIRANDLIDIRPIQVDYIPVFYSSRRDDSIRFSAGVKLKTNYSPAADAFSRETLQQSAIAF